MLTLYHAPRSRSFRTLWLLEEIGTPYDLKIVNIRRGDGSGAADAANPHPLGKVPALDHDGQVVFETAAIALYLTDLFPQSGLGPKIGDKERGAYLSWLAYYAGVFEPSLTAKFLKIQHIYGTFGWGPFEEVLEHLGSTLAAGPYLLGEKFSAADIVYGGSLPLLMSRGMVPETETFKAYAARVTGRSAFARAQAKDNG
jgi:glutathione S-transferase